MSECRYSLFGRWVLIIVLIAVAIPLNGSLAYSTDPANRGINVESLEKRGVRIWTEKGCGSVYQVGEQLHVRVSTQKSGYLTIFHLDPHGVVHILFPNRFRQDNYITKKKMHRIPGPSDSFKFTISLPKGVDKLLAVVTETKRRLVREDFSNFDQVFPKLSGSKGQVISQVSKGIEVIPNNEWWAADTCSITVGHDGDGDDGEDGQDDGEDSQDQLAGRALIVGIADYMNERVEVLGRPYKFNDLRYTVSDAREMKDVLKTRFKEIKILTNQEATYEAIERNVNNWLGSVEKGELAALYFSGHGAFQTDMDGDEEDGQDEVLVPFNYPEVEKFISDDQINDWFTSLPTNKVLYIADSCHAGTSSKMIRTFTTSGVMKSAYQEELRDSIGLDLEKGTRFGQKGENKQIVALEASQPDQSARESSDLKQGVFTYFLVKGMEGKADENADGKVTTKELFEFTKEKVLEFTENNQEPMCRGCDGAGFFLSISR